MNEKFKHLIGKRVTVEWHGLSVSAKLVETPPDFGGRDCIVQFPTEKWTRRVWASKVSEGQPVAV